MLFALCADYPIAVEEENPGRLFWLHISSEKRASKGPSEVLSYLRTSVLQGWLYIQSTPQALHTPGNSSFHSVFSF